jgi:hypothetical protein
MGIPAQQWTTSHSVLIAVMELIHRMSLVIFIVAIIFAFLSLATWHSRCTNAHQENWFLHF